MAQDDFPPFRIPALGRWIARAFVTLVAGARALARSVREAASARAGLIALRILVWPIRHHVLLLAATAVILFGGLWWDLIGHMRALLSEAARSAFDAEGEDRRGSAYLLAAGAAALVALASAPFALLKAWVNERATRTGEDKHLTERIMRAVEQLGAEKTVKKVVETEEIVDGERVKKAETLETTEPNLEVRLGAIYALERIAQDSERDHIPIMETLCAYVRENSNARKPSDAPKVRRALTNNDPTEVSSTSSNARKIRSWTIKIPTPRVDVQAATTVIGRRSVRRKANEALNKYRIDFENANLQSVELSKSSFERARLFRVRLEGAFLRAARMDEALLVGARMEGALLWEAQLEGSVLIGVRMEGADLFKANFRSADLMRWTNACARARSADFSGARNMTQEQVNAMFGDRSTILPEGLRRTDLMDRQPLEDPFGPDPDYEAWLAAGAPPGKPLP